MRCDFTDLIVEECGHCLGIKVADWESAPPSQDPEW